MKLFSSNNPQRLVDLKEAVLNAFPKDRGLYMPAFIPKMPDSFFATLENKSFTELSFELCSTLLQGAVEESALHNIINRAFNFPISIHPLSKNLAVAELYHGPSLAFKDFGARFMAGLMSYYLKELDEKRTILVATSGDTGGAVASGFYGVENINVVILYPSGKVSPFQENQLTRWGGNITAVEIDGTFDDCQRLVKQAFVDDRLSEFSFSSANSINIARLIPQSFYYFEAFKQSKNDNISISVPSGNFGNITAGVLAWRMGLPVNHFIAANNLNRSFTDYYNSGEYTPRESIRTTSNAMDVGDPSNFPRLLILLGSTWNMIKKKMKAWSFSDEDCCAKMKEIYSKHNYFIDPHTAIALLAADKYQTANDSFVVALSTAHPCKFQEIVNACTGNSIKYPKASQKYILDDKEAFKCGKEYNDFKTLLKLHLGST